HGPLLGVWTTRYLTCVTAGEATTLTASRVGSPTSSSSRSPAPRTPIGLSTLWLGPATKPSSEIEMWHVTELVPPRRYPSARASIVRGVADESNTGAVRRFYEELWNEWNPAVADEILDPEVRFRGTLGASHVGIEGF